MVISIHLHAYLCKINLNVLLSIKMCFSGRCVALQGRQIDRQAGN